MHAPKLHTHPLYTHMLYLGLMHVIQQAEKIKAMPIIELK